MQLVERHVRVNDESLDKICFLSKNLYNYVNYILRQVHLNKPENVPEFRDLIKSFTMKDGRIFYEIKEYDLTGRMAKLDQVDFRALPSQTSQQIIKLIYKNWSSFFKSIKARIKNKSKFKGKPKLLNYKHKTNGRNIVVFTYVNCRIKDGFIYFAKSANLKPLKTNVKSLQQVRIVPQATCYMVEVVYEKEIVVHKDLNENAYVGIDLGVDNLATLINNVGLQSFIINGKVLKSINQHFNEKRARLQGYAGGDFTPRMRHLTHSRNMKVQDVLHKTSRLIIDYSLENKIKNIVIGYNVGWKNESNMGDSSNQKFCNIPYETLVRQIEYKAILVGINVILNEEAHTSKCDALSLETVEHHDKYLGKRIKRGLFQSSTGKLINADVNGAVNILRKVIGDDFVRGLADKSTALVPVRVNCNKKLNKRGL